jgi:hypothetical protein
MKTKKKSNDRFDQYLEWGRRGGYGYSYPSGRRPYRTPVAHVPAPPPRELTPEEEAEKQAKELEQQERRKEWDAQREIFQANAAKWNEYKDLGWANGWRETPEAVKNCTHKYPDRGTIDDPSHRGYENKVFCAKCGWRYRYDSSD